ncbi:MAG TPA: DEAD/DEAH box helicase, partial [Chitinophagales bacterium]|nr:DEAD/DEAH box helicase [Chitinophagales bacterium]
MIETMTGFRALGLSNETLQALDQKGFEKPTPIQELTIPLLLEGEKDIVGQAQTGSGKTAAFGIPILERFDSQSKGVQAIILAPTRELAIQVANELASYKGNRRIRITTIYGGALISKQMRELERGTDIVVGTPGRVIDMIERKKLQLDSVRFVVLDEADEMLNMGFLDDVELILSKCNSDRRMLLFSATMPKRILNLAKRYMGTYELVEVENKGLTTASISQAYYQVPARNRFDALCRIMAAEEDFYGIVFCNTKMAVVEITNSLNERGYSADSLHGDIAQNLREKVINQFKRNGKGVLVATDVAARGIDIQDLTHVINYGLPQDPESYVHRIGRTGRAGKEGKAISIIDNNELRKLRFIQKATNASIQKANLPDAVDLVKLKKARLLEKVEEIISTEQHYPMMEYTYELLDDKDPALVI